jgi:hypothetical protein
MSNSRIATIEDLISKLNGAKEVLEKELGYDWSVTDELQNIIESLEHDLGELEVL